MSPWSPAICGALLEALDRREGAEAKKSLYSVARAGF